MFRILSSITIALSAFAAVPASAQDVPTVKVTYADLDLANPAGVKALRHRVARAITAVCGIPNASDLEAVLYSNACRKHATDGSSTQVAAAVEKAVQTASRGTNMRVASR